MKKKKKGRVLIRMGLALIVLAIALGAYNLYDNYRANRSARSGADYLRALVMPEAKQNTGAGISGSMADIPADSVAFDIPMDSIVVDVPSEVEIPDYLLNPNMKMPVSRYNGQDYIGILEIPALRLEIPVISDWDYPKLRIAPCRYSGSAYKNDMVISAHNYAAHFGGLDKLYEGAAVRFTDIDGNVFNYRVELKETLGPRDIEYMTDSGWDLTLFTCTPGGKYRVTVRCSLVK